MGADTDHRVWVWLVDGAITSSCETYAKQSVAVVAGKVMHGSTWAIASVFTPKDKRGRGYATAMLTALLATIKRQEGVLASTLYSDIGPTYYAKLGWALFPSTSLVLHSTAARQHLVGNRPAGSDHPLQTRLISQAELGDLLEGHARAIQTEYESHQHQDSFCILPSRQAQDWLLARSAFYLEHLVSDSLSGKQITCAGAKHPSGDFVGFFMDFKDACFYVSHAKITSREACRDLLLTACDQARGWNMDRVELWAETDLLVASVGVQELHGSLEAREESLSSLCFWGLEPESGTLPAVSCWQHNEKLAWC
ncbi:hypothetical protein HDV03_004073 [Kappamyces sp. JEL0829]|nr:hypothetical protein HDV03_004073 [Kappamyces sp. JEL0829]